MGDFTIDDATMRGVAKQAAKAGTEFASKQALSSVDGGCFGSAVVASAFAVAAAAQDAMIRSLAEDAATLASFVEDAAASAEQADGDLARRIG